jgi:hypothetical protein
VQCRERQVRAITGLVRFKKNIGATPSANMIHVEGMLSGEANLD